MSSGDEKEREKLRARIDDIDEAIARALQERRDIARRIGATKAGGAIFDPSREHEIMGKLAAKHPDLDTRSLGAVYREIISLCRSAQKQLLVASLGPGGSYSHQAALEALGESVDIAFFESPGDVIQAVAREETDLGVIPVENTIEGVVYASLDGLASAGPDLAIAMEVVMPVRHVLAGKRGNLGDITEIRSHPQALAQCRIWLSTHLPQASRKPASSTSAAALEAADFDGVAAVCSEAAAKKAGLEILARNIQDHSHNTTRFWIIGKGSEMAPPKTGKISVLFTVAHKPGSLFHALEPLRDSGANLMFIQSRPLVSNPFEYLFFVDMEAAPGNDRVLPALDIMASRCFSFRILGVYPSRACR
ncbi:MAG: prephenate dehydratase [Thermovirgaceae bacterium]